MSGDQAPAPCPHPFDELNERLREGFRALAEALAPLAAFGSKPAPRVSAAPCAPNATAPEGEAGDEADRARADRTALRDRIAALFRHPPGQERLGDATPGEIADAVLAEVWPTIETAWRMAERVTEVHMRFGVLGEPDSVRCADWCHLCRVERAAAALERVRALARNPRTSHGRVTGYVLAADVLAALGGEAAGQDGSAP